MTGTLMLCVCVYIQFIAPHAAIVLHLKYSCTQMLNSA